MESSYHFSSRVERAMQQKIYLLEAYNVDNTWTFIVQGSTGINYELFFDKNKTSCSCPDCSGRNHTCKHIIFIIGRVAKDLETLKTVNMTLKSFLNERLNEKLNERLNERLNSEEKEEIVLLEENTECIICFDEIKSIVKSEQSCDICKISYHKECINRWLKTSSCCCHCRQQWKKQSKDELKILKVFKKQKQ